MEKFETTQTVYHCENSEKILGAFLNHFSEVTLIRNVMKISQFLKEI